MRRFHHPAARDVPVDDDARHRRTDLETGGVGDAIRCVAAERAEPRLRCAKVRSRRGRCRPGLFHLTPWDDAFETALPREGLLRELHARTRRDDLRAGLPEFDALQDRERLSLGHGVADAHEHLADPGLDRRADLRILLLVHADLAEHHHALAAGAGLDDARRHPEVAEHLGVDS